MVVELHIGYMLKTMIDTTPRNTFNRMFDSVEQEMSIQDPSREL